MQNEANVNHKAMTTPQSGQPAEKERLAGRNRMTTATTIQARLRHKAASYTQRSARHG